MVQLRFRRSRDDAEHVGDLVVLVALDVVQHEHLARAVGEAAHRVVEVHRDVRGMRPARRRFERRGGVVEASPLHAERRAPRQDHIHGQAVQPGPEGRFAPEGRELLPGADEDVLGDVVGSFQTHHAAHQAVDARRVRAVQALERTPVPARREGRVRGFRILRSTLGAVAPLITGGGLHLPARLAPAADLLVALLLIALGGTVIWRYARGRWHLHVHVHDGGPHLHLHSHAHGAAHEHAHPRGDARRSLGFGLLHGLAGSAAILVLLIAAAPTRAAQLAYFLAFAIVTMTGMLGVSLSLAAITRLASPAGARWATALHLGSAVVGIAGGVAVAARGAPEPLELCRERGGSPGG